jgi:hypothetical protein
VASICKLYNDRQTRARVRALLADPAEVDFTAQTTIAASYGLMQVMYTTAIRPMGWTGLKVTPACDPTDCNPRYLFDIPANLQLGGGSIEIASSLLRKGFIENNRGVSLNASHLFG